MKTHQHSISSYVGADIERMEVDPDVEGTNLSDVLLVEDGRTLAAGYERRAPRDGDMEMRRPRVLDDFTEYANVVGTIVYTVGNVECCHRTQ